jgi:hypothetical protein
MNESLTHMKVISARSVSCGSLECHVYEVALWLITTFMVCPSFINGFQSLHCLMACLATGFSRHFVNGGMDFSLLEIDLHFISNILIPNK